MSRARILTLENVHKTFQVGFWRRRVEAVRDVTFAIEDNEIFGLVGPNGAGKTTTMKMMTNLIFPDAGQVRLFGEPTGETASRRRLGYLPEEPYFYGHLSVVEMLHYYGALHGMARSAVDDRIDDLLELVGLEDVPDRPLRNYSKGMRQRAGIAQALVNDPDLVILDEPQSGLDPIGRKEVRDLILTLREAGKTILFSSHILVDVEAVCDRVAILNDGDLVDVTDLDDLDADHRQRVELRVDGLAPEDADDLEGLERLDRAGSKLIVIFSADVPIEPILSDIIDRGGRILELDRHGRRLEQQFLADTQSPS